MRKVRFLGIAGLLLAVLLSVCPFSVSATGSLPASDSGYLLAANNENLELYADMETGHFSLVNKNTGVSWNSVPTDLEEDEITKSKDKLIFGSEIVIKYIITENEVASAIENSANSKVACERKGGIDVEKVKDGIRVTYSFSELGFIIPVEYTLNGDYLRACIDVKGIKEGKEYTLTAINLLPAFGAANSKTNGYLFIPDGSGALIDFNNGKQYGYEKVVYGDDAAIDKQEKTENKETIRMPVFGTVKSDDSLMGVIATGDAGAYITATVGNEKCGYNMVSSIFRLREITNATMLSHSAQTAQVVYRLSPAEYAFDEYEVLYYPLDGESSGYVGMARKYRDYLVENEGFEKKEYKPSVSLNVYGAVEVEGNFLGIKYSKLKPLTTYKQLTSIINDLNDEGIENLAVRYIGWNNNGTLNKRLPTNVKTISCLGGNKAWKTLIATSKNTGTVIYPEIDILSFRKGSKSQTVLNSFNKISYQYEYYRSVYATDLAADKWKLISPDLIVGSVEKLLKKFTNYSESIALSSLANSVYSNFSDDRTVSRSTFPETVKNALGKVDAKKISVAAESANAFALPITQRVYNQPAYSSGYKIFDREVPFYQIVVHGYTASTVSPMQHAIDANQWILKAAETGSELLYNCMYEDASVISDTSEDELYSSTYSLIKDTIIEQYKMYMPLLSKIYDKEIISHREIEENVTETIFDGGVRVIVNYTDVDITVEGKTVSARSFIEA